MDPMQLDRRQFLALGSACLASCGAGVPRPAPLGGSRLDVLLVAHAGALPERAGAGANHYPMAAEVLAAHGREDAIDDAWIQGAAGYAGELGRVQPIESEADLAAALGSYERYGDLLDRFRAELARSSWSAVLGRWAPRLAPAISAAAFHGVIRTGHAARALSLADTAARRGELAAGLAYWAARYAELPTGPSAPALRADLASLSSPWQDDRSDVGFEAVSERLLERPLAPAVTTGAPDARTRRAPREELDVLVRDAATGFLEMLALERNRLWLLHTVTGPAAVEWLLPHVDELGARRLVDHARQAVVAMYLAFGEPFVPRAHLRDGAPDWPAQIARAADSRSVHGIKLIDALARFERQSDPLWRSIAAQWFEWT